MDYSDLVASQTLSSSYSSTSSSRSASDSQFHTPPASKISSSSASSTSGQNGCCPCQTSNGLSNGFEALVHALRQKLGPSSGITDDDPSKLQALMEDYVSKRGDWEKYEFRAPEKNYTRNLVDKGNGKSNLMVLVWTPGKGSPVHDHANAHCIMKILKGKLVETRYHWPTVQLNNNEARPLEVQQETTFQENEVTYMSDKLGLHKISNPDKEEYAVSLHLYTPPNAAVYGCNTFDEQTGKPSHQKGCPVYSEYGKKISHV